MRVMGLLCTAALVSGCSILSTQPTLNPEKVYLGPLDQVIATRREVDDYACLNGPLVCDGIGITMECRCMLY